MTYTFHYDKLQGVCCFIRSDGKQSDWDTGQDCLEILAMTASQKTTYAESLTYD